MKFKTRKKKDDPNRKRTVYPIIPNSTLEHLMERGRWDEIIKEVKRKYGTSKVLIGYFNEGAMVYLKDEKGKRLGTVAQLDKWATKQRKKRA